MKELFPTLLSADRFDAFRLALKSKRLHLDEPWSARSPA